MLTRSGRNARLLAAGLVLLGLAWGTAWGQDDHFPVGPFRMFSTTNKLDGVVRTVRIEAVDADGRSFDLTPDTTTFGLRRAEIEGQLHRFSEDPSLLRHLARSYGKIHPGEPSLVRLYLYESVVRLVGGRPADELEVRPVARWGS